VSYEFLDDIATADVAFKASGSTLPEMFRCAAEAVLHVMLPDAGQLMARRRRTIRVAAQDVEMLLFQFLQELIFLKDARKLLMRVKDVQIDEDRPRVTLQARAEGEPIDPRRHQLNVDIKAVTLHQFCVRQIPDGWEAVVVLDI